MSEDTNRAVLDAIGTLRSEVGALRSEVGTLRSDVTTEIGALRSEIGTLRSEHVETRTAIMGRVDRVQESVEQLRNEMKVNWATADTAIRRVRGAEDEARGLYDLIAAMQREIQTLAARVDGMDLRRGGL
jgi:chromosome segregation ATPase